MKKIFCLTLALVLMLSITSFAGNFTTIDTSVTNGHTAVNIKEGVVSITLTQQLSDVSGVTMKKDYATFVDFTATINPMYPNILDVTFLGDMDYDTEYIIDYAACENLAGETVSGYSKLVFRTELEPVITLDNIIFTKGVGSAVTETDPASFGDDDSNIQGFKVFVNNKASQATTVNIVCALYDSDDIIKKVISTEKSISASSVEAVELGTIIDSTLDGGKVKIYVWDNLSDKTPFIGCTEIEIH